MIIRKEDSMHKALAAAAVAAACSAPLLATAQTPAPAAPPSDWTVSGNIAIVSDYRFRGFTQTNYNPGLQGGIDIGHSSGFYVGNWNANVDSVLFNGASLEMDFYGGYKHSFGDFGLDVGVLYYYYPGTGEYNPDFKPDNFEAYIGGSWGPLSAKFYYSFTNFFDLKNDAAGIDSKGSYYVDLNGNFPLDGGFAIVAHAGYQYVSNYEQLGGIRDDVWDYKLGATYDILGSGWIVGAFWVGTSEKDFFLTTENPPQAAGKNRFLATLSKTF